MTDAPVALEPIDNLDPLIAPYVRILREGGVVTVQSCQGGKGHAFPEPTIQFLGPVGALWQALSVLMSVDAGVSKVRIGWNVGPDNLPDGPVLEVVLYDLERELNI